MAKHLKFGMEKNYKMVMVQNFHVVYDNFQMAKPMLGCCKLCTDIDNSIVLLIYNIYTV
jgi:hypothetical protein